MPADRTLSKGVTDAQFKAFEEARQLAGLTDAQAKDAAYRLFCESQGVAWPETGKHGGDRRSGLPLKTRLCDRCGETMNAEPHSEDYECSNCGLHSERTPQGWQDYEIVNGQRVERDHNNRGAGW